MDHRILTGRIDRATILSIGGWKAFMTQRAIDGNYIYFVTANVQDRRWFFANPERAAKLGQAIQTCCRLKHFDLLAYCILPNHVHLLVRRMGIDEALVGAGETQRTLERVRCEEESVRLANSSFPLAGQKPDVAVAFLFPHRRLSSRRCGPSQRYTLSDLMKSIKGTFSRNLAKGKFWQRRSYFRIIEDETYLANVLNYIRFNYRKMNPVRAALLQRKGPGQVSRLGTRRSNGMNLPLRYGEAPFVFIDKGAIEGVFKE